MKAYLEPTPIIDFRHPGILEFAQEFTSEKDAIAKAIKLYEKVRDHFLYNPFDIKTEGEHLRASALLARGHGHCIDKAVFLIACSRALGIPARLGLSRVKNHIGTARFEQIIQSNELVPHGYAELYLAGEWIKCTPAFNASLCAKLGVEPLEFDGRNHSQFQQYTEGGESFMEYIEDYGTFADVPLDFIIELMTKYYPHLFDKDGRFRTELFQL